MNDAEKSGYCLIARYHKGDENGHSIARFARLGLSSEAIAAGYEEVRLDPNVYRIEFRESGKGVGGFSSLRCKTNPAEVIIRRRHSGDENGMTMYEFAKVIAKKRMKDGSYKEYTCIASDFFEVRNDNESKAGWVQLVGSTKVIIGRDHHGDEKGKTITYFGNIYILEENGTKYKLELFDEEDLPRQKESESDFYKNIQIL